MNCPICGVSRDAFADETAWLSHVRLHPSVDVPQAEAEARARLEQVRQEDARRREVERWHWPILSPARRRELRKQGVTPPTEEEARRELRKQGCGQTTRSSPLVAGRPPQRRT
jgi:hypothetical protein